MDVAKVSDWLADCAGAVSGITPVSGGDTATALRVATANGDLFLKIARAQGADGLAAEARGLALLRDADALRVPHVVATGGEPGVSWLALEWLDLVPATRANAHELGERLAQLHRAGHATYGLDHDNTIGASPQYNAPCADWPGFFADQRLGAQRQLAQQHRHMQPILSPLAEVIAAVPQLLADTTTVPSLVHGDLWGGNWGALGTGEPVVFDPPVSYKHRENAQAMTELFGGF